MNIADAQEAILKGEAFAKEWFAAFIAEWTQPVTDQMVLAWWNSMTPEQHAYLKASNPQAHAEVEKKIRALQRKRG